MLHNLDADSSKIIEVLNQDPNGVRLTQAQVLYVEYLVSNMKAIGTWQLSNAVYGFVGGTDYKHKFNWKDPRDLDAAFRLTYSGGITHSANGMQGNGTTGYADTKLSASANLSNTNAHLCFYSNLNTNRQQVSIGSSTTGSFNNIFDLISESNFVAIEAGDSSAYDFVINYASATKGFYLGQKIGTRLSMQNNDFLSFKTTTQPLVTSTVNIALMARNASGSQSLFSNRPYQLFTIGAGLTDQQAIQQSQIVTNAQMILSRA